jgi:hypothetical protein
MAAHDRKIKKTVSGIAPIKADEQLSGNSFLFDQKAANPRDNLTRNVYNGALFHQ